MKLCVTTVVDRNYMYYVPIFVYCMNKAYPEYHVKLFLRDPCPYSLKGLNCETVPLFEDFPRYTYMSIALRFAVDKEHFKEFDYVYVTDIDMMIMREHRDIEYFHCMEMYQTNLCYSNSLRNANHYQGTKSLTGLHFATKEWFERTDDLVAEYRENMKKGLIGIYREYDGMMLYRLADRCELGLPGKYRLTNRHHGIHLNNFKIFGANRLKLDSRIQSDHRQMWFQYLGNKAFRGLCEIAKQNDEARRNLEMMELYCTGKL